MSTAQPRKGGQSGSNDSHPETSAADIGRPVPRPGSTAAHRAETHPPMTYPFLAPPQQPDELGRLGPFRVLEKLGEGGMGVVFAAEEVALRRHVALKVMLPKVAENATAKARFLREARAQAAIESDHVIAIHQVAEDRGVPYIAMPLLKGQMLATALKVSPRPPVSEVLRIGREMAEGLAAAHAVGLIHRDIKPGNVWLEDSKRRVKILDFGLARVGEGVESEDSDDVTVTRKGAIVGTPAYMSPEQARGEPLDARTDLFSLGVVLYEMTVGERPFRGKDTMSVLFALAADAPAPPHEKNPAVPLALSHFILRLLAKDREQRPGSGQAVVEELRRIADMSNRTAVVPGAVPPPVANDPWADIELTEGDAIVSVAGGAASVRAGGVNPRASASVPWKLIAAGVVVMAAGVAGVFALADRERAKEPVAETRPPVRPPVERKPPPPKDRETPAPVVPPQAVPAEEAAYAELVESAKKQQAEWAAKLGKPVEEPNSLGMAMVLIPPVPGTDVPLLIGKYEVTQEEWQQVMGYNPSEFQRGGARADKVVGLDTSKFPVEKVSWFDGVEFCNKLSEKEGLPPYYELAVEERKGASIEKAEVKILGGKGYHLPTDAEWTWACAAGAKWPYHFGKSEGMLHKYSYYSNSSGGRPHAVGELLPNAWGLYDTHGNVREWTEEILKKADGAPERVYRGGNWFYPAAYCAVSFRNRNVPGVRNNADGLRLARVP